MQTVWKLMAAFCEVFGLSPQLFRVFLRVCWCDVDTARVGCSWCSFPCTTWIKTKAFVIVKLKREHPLSKKYNKNTQLMSLFSFLQVLISRCGKWYVRATFICLEFRTRSLPLSDSGIVEDVSILKWHLKHAISKIYFFSTGLAIHTS